MSALAQAGRTASGIPGRAWLAIGLLATGGFFALLSPPWTPAERFYFFGHGLCHQIPGRSFEMGGVQLPLCARCTGIYLGALTAIVWFVVTGRGRSGTLPKPVILFTMLGSFVFMGIDGVNSYIRLANGELGRQMLSFGPLYEPQNILRIVTGGLVGLTVATLLFGVVNSTLWEKPNPRPLITGFGQLAAMVGSFLVVALIVNAEPAWLAQPASLAVGLGLFAVFIGINLVIVLSATGRDGKVRSWTDLALPAAVALGLAVVEMSLLSFGRTYAVTALNLPL